MTEVPTIDTHAPTAEELARAALRVSVQANREQQALTEESRLLLAALLREEMASAVTKGIAAALTDANAATFCRSVLAEAQKMATVKAGEVGMGMFKALAGRIILFTFLGSLIYAVGGWTALAAMGKFFAGDK